uniref:Uncharacterized protein n=1 Tax=Meloidogyne hapla TaxID=6305 RepID=A0A1I8BRQ9_MELHA
MIQLRRFSTSLVRSVVLPIKQVSLKNIVLSTKQPLPATPKRHIKTSLKCLKNRHAASASNEMWLASSNQLKIFLRTYELDVESYSMKNEVVKYLIKHYAPNKEELRKSWKNSYALHLNGYEDELDLYSIHALMLDSYKFCNIIFDIKQQNLFNKQKLLEDWKGGLDRQVLPFIFIFL